MTYTLKVLKDYKERNMKKIIFSLLLSLLTLCTAFAVEETYRLRNVDSKNIGIYIPVDIENQIRKTRLFYESLNVGHSFHHDVLFLTKNICFSDVGFHDGYAIESKDFKNYRFVENDNGIFCIDENGNSYKKIPGKLNKKGYGYEAFADYVMNIIISFAKDMKNIQIKDGTITIDGITYEVNLDRNFFCWDNIAIWLYNENGFYALVKNGINGELHKGYIDEDYIWCASNEKIKEFPLMFIDTNEELPWYGNLPKNQYRYLRNLVYARHGYTFNSQELKDFFSQFNWYTPDSQFSESDLNLQEKEYIEFLLKEENK
ncbi:MAG: YARHG domain-containing protein [Treponema sp.]|nr:YARHG domain-containing protein [Treponema sp.]